MKGHEALWKNVHRYVKGHHVKMLCCTTYLRGIYPSTLTEGISSKFHTVNLPSDSNLIFGSLCYPAAQKSNVNYFFQILSQSTTFKIKIPPNQWKSTQQLLWAELNLPTLEKILLPYHTAWEEIRGIFTPRDRVWK